MANSAIGSTAATPIGPAGGDLTGTYPNPGVALVGGMAANSLPRGIVASATITASQLIANSSGTFTSALGITNVNSVGRLWRITFACEGLSSTAAGDRPWVTILDSVGPTTLAETNIIVPLANATYPATIIWVGRASAGLHTYNITCSRIQGTGNAGYTAQTYAPAQLIIEDIGP